MIKGIEIELHHEGNMRALADVSFADGSNLDNIAVIADRLGYRIALPDTAEIELKNPGHEVKFNQSELNRLEYAVIDAYEKKLRDNLKRLSDNMPDSYTSL